jgi:hypothetical protein
VVAQRQLPCILHFFCFIPLHVDFYWIGTCRILSPLAKDAATTFSLNFEGAGVQ